MADIGDDHRVWRLPDCGKRSIHRHGWHERYLQDLPAQGAPATVKLRLQRWQCRNGACKRKTFTTQAPEVAAPRARRTARATEVVYLFGHGVGGRPGERLIKRIGMPMSDDTILRCLKRRVKARGSERKTRVVGVDDWAWRKASTYGTIIVDLEQREVVDLFPERAASMTADWLKMHPGVEIISRDRCGSFAQGAHEGAPQARQIADRFHIVQNLREAVQVQLSRAPGFCARPLLPADGADVASVRDKHGGDEHRRLTRWRTAFEASGFRSGSRAARGRAEVARHRATNGVRSPHDRHRLLAEVGLVRRASVKARVAGADHCKTPDIWQSTRALRTRCRRRADRLPRISRCAIIARRRHCRARRPCRPC